MLMYKDEDGMFDYHKPDYTYLCDEVVLCYEDLFGSKEGTPDYTRKYT